jgi:hypothetical protein
MFGLPKRQVKEKIDYLTGIPVLSIIYPTEEESRTRLLFNKTAVETFNISDTNPVAFQFEGNRVYVGSIEGVNADGETYLEVYTSKEYAGIYAYNKKYAEAIRKKFKAPVEVDQMNFKLDEVEIEGVRMFELTTISEFTEALKFQEVKEPVGYTASNSDLVETN